MSTRTTPAITTQTNLAVEPLGTTHGRTEKPAFPPLPYKGLSFYGPNDAPLFAGRDRDVIECANLLAHSSTRILLLHGSTGCGKSSFLRAGLIPYLDDPDSGFQFLRDSKDNKLQVLFIRSTNKPLVELAKRVYDFAKQDVSVKTPRGEHRSLNLPEIVESYTEAAFVEGVGRDPARMIEVLRLMAAKLTRTLVLIVDQGEEVITLSAEDGKENFGADFFDFMSRFNRTDFDLKLLVALRTEYFGRFCGKMQQSDLNPATLSSYLLEDFSAAPIIDAIMRPTLTEPVSDYGVPHEHYRFGFAPGLPEKIAADLMAKRLAGGVLPVMQVVCDRLYLRTKAANSANDASVGGVKEWVITEADYNSLGGIEVQMEENLSQTLAEWCKKSGITSDGDVQREIECWKKVLATLVRSQADGTVTTEVKSECDLKAETDAAKCKIDFDKTMDYLTRDGVRILREVSLVSLKTKEPIKCFSLGHDAIGLTLRRWRVIKEETEALKTVIKRTLRLLGLGLMVLSVVLFLLLFRFKDYEEYSFPIPVCIFILGLMYLLVTHRMVFAYFQKEIFSQLVWLAPYMPKTFLEQWMENKDFIDYLRRNPEKQERFQKYLNVQK